MFFHMVSVSLRQKLIALYLFEIWTKFKYWIPRFEMKTKSRCKSSQNFRSFWLDLQRGKNGEKIRVKKIAGIYIKTF